MSELDASPSFSAEVFALPDLHKKITKRTSSCLPLLKPSSHDHGTRTAGVFQDEADFSMHYVDDEIPPTMQPTASASAESRNTVVVSSKNVLLHQPLQQPDVIRDQEMASDLEDEDSSSLFDILSNAISGVDACTSATDTAYVTRDFTGTPSLEEFLAHTMSPSSRSWKMGPDQLPTAVAAHEALIRSASSETLALPRSKQSKKGAAAVTNDTHHIQRDEQTTSSSSSLWGDVHVDAVLSLRLSSSTTTMKEEQTTNWFQRNSRVSKVECDFLEFEIHQEGPPPLSLSAASAEEEMGLQSQGSGSDRTPTPTYYPTPVIISKSGTLIFSGCPSSGDIDIRQVADDTKQVIGVGTLFGHSAPVICLSFSKDDRLLASGALDAVVLLWQLSKISKSYRKPHLSRRPMHILRGHTSAVVDVTIDTELAVCVSLSASGDALVHSVKHGRLVRRLQPRGRGSAPPDMFWPRKDVGAEKDVFCLPPSCEVSDVSGSSSTDRHLFHKVACVAQPLASVVFATRRVGGNHPNPKLA